MSPRQLLEYKLKKFTYTYNSLQFPTERIFSDSKPPATFILFHNSEITITAADYQLIKI